MQQIYWLEELRGDWQSRCKAAITQVVRDHEGKLATLLGDKPGDSPEVRLTRATEWTDDKTRVLANQLMADCPVWLRERELWPETSDQNHVGPELAAALQYIPHAPLSLPASTVVIPTRSWAITAAIGALLGMVVLTPLSMLLFGIREVGLGMGGILGSAALVVLTGFLSHSPRLRSAVSQVLALSTAGSIVGGIWTVVRRGAMGWLGWLRGALGFAGMSFYLLLTQPRSEPVIDLDQIRGMLRAHLEHVADLILGWCWAHPSRNPGQPDNETGKAPVLPPGVCDVLAELFTDLNGTQPPEDLREMVDVLFQRFQDHGFVWSAVKSGTPFEESMRDEFEIFGIVAAGQPVRTRRASFTFAKKVERKGELRRVQ